MRIIARKMLIDLWTKHPETEQSLKAWFDRTRKSVWQSTQDVLKAFGTARPIDADWISFKIQSNDYSLFVAFRFDVKIA